MVCVKKSVLQVFGFFQRLSCLVKAGIGLALIGGFLFLYSRSQRYLPKKTKKVGVVSSILCYPVTLCQSVASDVAMATKRGPKMLGVLDRRFYIAQMTDDNSNADLYHSPDLDRIKFQLDGKNLTLSYPDKGEVKFCLAVPETNPVRLTTFHEEILAVDCGDQVAEWLQGCFSNTRLRLLMRFSEELRNTAYVFLPKSSFMALNKIFKINPPLSIEYFRPHIVIADSEEFDELNWESLFIGSHSSFTVVSSYMSLLEPNYNKENKEWDYEVESYRPLEKVLSLPTSCPYASVGILATVKSSGDISIGDTVYATYKSQIMLL